MISMRCAMRTRGNAFRTAVAAHHIPACHRFTTLGEYIMSTNTARPTRFYHRPAGKALLAVGAGALLLAGAGGTFATWSDTKSVGAGTITDGELKLAVEPGSWKNGDTEIPDIADFKMVPGDTVTFTTTVTPTIVGDNLKATLSATLPNDESQWTVVSTMTGGDGVLTDADSGQSYPVTVDVTLPAESGNTSQEATLNLGELTFKLDQNNPVPAG